MLLQSLKDKPCHDCGILYEPFCMDFDHLGNKTKNVSRMALDHSPRIKILEEIKKCDLVCVLCHNVRTKNRLDEKHPIKKYSKTAIRNINIINNAKDKPCVMCGKLYEIYNMQLDHVDPMTKFKNICQLKQFKIDTLIKEIDKCQILCALCHRRKSILEQKLKNTNY